ncbi:MAG: hypothetical protein FWD25_13540, partial [Clostridia bacterium]|nr:hypothetical protein [Clostridia bacterium]
MAVRDDALRIYYHDGYDAADALEEAIVSGGKVSDYLKAAKDSLPSDFTITSLGAASKRLDTLLGTSRSNKNYRTFITTLRDNLDEAERIDKNIWSRIEQKALSYAFDPDGRKDLPLDLNNLTWLHDIVDEMNEDLALAEEARRKAREATNAKDRNAFYNEARAAEARANAKALSLYVKLRANKDNLPDYPRSLYDRTAELLRDGNGTKTTFTPEQLALMRGMTKMMLAGIQEPRMYPDTEGSEEYNPNNPITIGSMD